MLKIKVTIWTFEHDAQHENYKAAKLAILRERPLNPHQSTTVCRLRDALGCIAPIDPSPISLGSVSLIYCWNIARKRVKVQPWNTIRPWMPRCAEISKTATDSMYTANRHHNDEMPSMGWPRLYGYTNVVMNKNLLTAGYGQIRPRMLKVHTNNQLCHLTFFCVRGTDLWRKF
jgi:hypothetical protein